MSKQHGTGLAIAGLSLFVGYFLVVVATGVGVIWAVIHFVRKFW